MGAGVADAGAERRICGPRTRQLGFTNALGRLASVSPFDRGATLSSSEQVVLCDPVCPGEQQKSITVLGLRIPTGVECGMVALEGAAIEPVSVTSETIISDAIARSSNE